MSKDPEKKPYELRHRDFRALTKSESFDIHITVEDDNHGQLPWISCRGLSFSDAQGSMWHTTDVRTWDGYTKAFHIPIIGFKFDFWSSGMQHFTAYVEPRPGKYNKVQMLVDDSVEEGEDPNEIRMQIVDPELMRFLAGRRLHIRVSAPVARTGSEEEE